MIFELITHNVGIAATSEHNFIFCYDEIELLHKYRETKNIVDFPFPSQIFQRILNFSLFFWISFLIYHSWLL